MTKFSRPVEIRWSDLDPNFHVLHSKYYDFAANCRVHFLSEQGITMAVLSQLKLGPILFREECIFKKEIRFGDQITVTLKLKSSTRDYSRWTMVHELFRDNDIPAALITVDGAWMDTEKRKLTVPPKEILKGFEDAPRTTDFKFY